MGDGSASIAKFTPDSVQAEYRKVFLCLFFCVLLIGFPETAVAAVESEMVVITGPYMCRLSS